jgi:hypothetical protein
MDMPDDVNTPLDPGPGTPANDVNPGAVRETKAAREQRERTERLEPRLARLKEAQAENFLTALERCLGRNAAERLKKPDRRWLLDSAWASLPPGLGGAVIAKHFKTGDQWTFDDVMAGIDSVTAAMSERAIDPTALGVMLHGALQCLIDATTDARAGQKSKRSKKDVAAKFVELHRTILARHPAPIPWPQHVDPLKLLVPARELIANHADPSATAQLADSLSFGFPIPQAAAPSVPPTSGPTITPVQEPTPDVQPIPVPPPAQPDGPIHGPGPEGAVPQADVDGLKRKLKALSEEFDALRAESGRLKSELRRAQDSEARTLQTHQELGAARDALSETATRLRSELESRDAMLEQCRASLDALCGLGPEVERLKSALRQAEEQNELAKNTEFARGQRSMRSQIAAHCLEGLRQIITAADGLPGDQAFLIRELAKDFERYLSSKGE